jgi:serine/threonine protein kinase
MKSELFSERQKSKNLLEKSCHQILLIGMVEQMSLGLYEYPYEGATFGDYRLMRGLGHGGFADVYLGTDVELGKSFAVKVINTKFPQQQQVDKFKKEARIVASLEHRHIIEVYRYGVEGNVPYIVMKYAQNGSVRSKHPRGTILTLATVVAYARQVAEALEHAHAQGLIHRDVKPENMLFGAFGEILLSDFGVAILTDSRRVDPQEIEGTLPYMAPEQFEAKAVRQSDQYALGIVVYEWLTGDVPFRVKNIYEAAVQHKSSPVPAMNQFGMMIPSEIEAVILKALAKEPQDRFKSVTDFIQALEEVLQQVSITSTIGAKLWTYRENEAEVLTVAWSPDGSRIMTGNKNGTDRVIDSLNGQTQHIHIFEHIDTFKTFLSVDIPNLSEDSLDPSDFIEWLKHSKNALIAISNGCDGNASLSITGLDRGTLQRWNVIVNPSHQDSEQGVFIAWNADCTKYLAYYIYNVYKHESSYLYDFYPHNQAIALLALLFYPEKASGKKPFYEVPNNLLRKIFISENSAFAWSHGNELAAVASEKDGLLIIDLSTYLFSQFTEEQHINALAWSPKDRILALGTFDGQIRLLTIEGTNLLSINVSSNPIRAIAWKPNGTQIAVAHGTEVSIYQVK